MNARGWQEMIQALRSCQFLPILNSIIFLSTHIQEPAPAPFIKDMIESAQFFANRIKSQYKEK